MSYFVIRKHWRNWRVGFHLQPPSPPPLSESVYMASLINTHIYISLNFVTLYEIPQPPSPLKYNFFAARSVRKQALVSCASLHFTQRQAQPRGRGGGTQGRAFIIISFKINHYFQFHVCVYVLCVFVQCLHSSACPRTIKYWI